MVKNLISNLKTFQLYNISTIFKKAFDNINIRHIFAVLK